ncbi:hypothetical protein AZKH_p0195 (plasmid) [Azoarcus sp. KH32C]|nr:hypothetical protein AZKH_p0195 [Azoarcus sp. KH32C]
MLTIGRALITLRYGSTSRRWASHRSASSASSRFIRELNTQRDMTILLVEQNAHHALRVNHRGYVLQHQQIVLAPGGANLDR